MTEMTTGERVARARRRKAWTQADLATVTGRSVSWVAKIERGHAALDRRSVVDLLARVLDVEVVELTGQPYRPKSSATESGHAGIPAVRLALQRASLPQLAALDRETRPIADVAAHVERLEQLRQAANFGPVATELPAVLEELVRLCRDQGGDVANSLMVRASHLARVMANLTGHHDLAWMAIERELSAAQAVGAPVEQSATWDLCGAWLHVGALEEARNSALAGINALEPHVDSRDARVLSMWGALHLRAAVAFGRLWSAEDARGHIEEARRVVPRQGNVWQTQFNAPNLLIHELEVSVELGRPIDTEKHAAEVPADEIESAERLSHYWVCRARGLGMNNQGTEALEALLKAEQIAGSHVLNRPMARELVVDLLTRSRRGVRPELRRLASRMDVA